jgi:O-antigen/teichoic acid export membrane protein
VKTEQSSEDLTSGSMLARSTGWNMLGQLLPLLVGALAVPALVRGLGVERFGLLSLAWVVVGYFSLFDLGIGRALTKLVADKIGANDQKAIPGLIWTSLCLLLLLGFVGGLVAIAISPWLVRGGLKISERLQPEALRMFYLLSPAIPLITVTSGLRGVLEALQQFRVITLIRIPISILSFAGPLLVLPFSHSLVPVVAVLLLGRILGAGVHFLACLHAMPLLRRIEIDRAITSSVLKFGGWMTVSNLVSPMMVYMDRFLIGSLLSVGAIAYYTAPFDMVTRLLLIPGGIAGVLFPALAVSLIQRSQRTELLLARGEKYIFLAVFPIVLVIVALAPEALRLWLGDSFATNGAAALRWLAAGVFVNSLAQIPYVLIQSGGRPDITAKIQLCELPLYLAAVWFLTKGLGVEGTAIAWAARSALDAFLMFFLARHVIPRKSETMVKLGLSAVGGLVLLCLSTLSGRLVIKGAVLMLVLLAFVVAVWFVVLDSTERGFLLRVGRGVPA